MPTRVTNLIPRAKSGDESAKSRIVQHFWAAARRAALQKWNWRPLPDVDPSDVANAALRSALSDLSKPASKFGNRTELEQLVVLIAKRKAVSALRKSKAAKRGTARKLSFDDFDKGAARNRYGKLLPQERRYLENGEVVVPDPEVPDLVTAEELGYRIGNSAARESDDYKRYVDTLFAFGEYSAPEVREMASLKYPDTPLRTIRWFELRFNELRVRLADELRRDYPEFIKRWEDGKEERRQRKKSTPNRGGQAPKNVGRPKSKRRTKKKK